MSKIDLTSKTWCDLIFEGKNKQFGAYPLRMDSARRHNYAMIIVLVIAVALFSIPLLLKFVLPKQDKLVVTEVTTLSKLNAPKAPEEQEQPKVLTPPPPPLKKSIKFTAPVIKKVEEVTSEEEMKTQDELNTSTASISIADVKGSDDKNAQEVTDLQQVIDEGDGNGTYETVEQMPSFPGGDEALMKYLHDHLKYPQHAKQRNIQGRVMARFVVGKDGSISGVEIVKGLHPECDEEVIRLINSMPKWIPGKQNGKNVAVYFRLPVTFRLIQ